MKNIIIPLSFLFSISAFSQVAIGKNSITNTSVSLEFGSGNKGIILPWVDSAAGVTGAVSGTIIYDTTDHKVKVKRAAAWRDLSIDTTGAADTSLQNSLTDSNSAKVAIGVNGDSDTTPGILVLTDTDKAMILPKVASPALNIKNPAPGMLVYDTTAHQLAVFNGTVWSFWLP